MESDIRHLSELESVKRLKYEHARLLDSLDARIASSKFAEDAIWDRGLGAVHRGRVQVQERLAESFRHMRWSQHNVCAVLVTIEASGDLAHGEFSVIECFDWDGVSLI
jgi:ketosteroid isomerase-like protein